MNDFRDIGTRLSNWGRWGQDDERGTLNHITPAGILAAAQCIRSGRVFELSLPLSGAGPQQGRAGRTNPVHTMTMLPGDLNSPDGLVVSDDMITMPLQRIQGTLAGHTNPLADLPRLMELYRTGDLKLDELITKRYSLDQVNEMYHDMLDGKNIRGVMIHPA